MDRFSLAVPGAIADRQSSSLRQSEVAAAQSAHCTPRWKLSSVSNGLTSKTACLCSDQYFGWPISSGRNIHLKLPKESAYPNFGAVERPVVGNEWNTVSVTQLSWVILFLSILESLSIISLCSSASLKRDLLLCLAVWWYKLKSVKRNLLTASWVSVCSSYFGYTAAFFFKKRYNFMVWIFFLIILLWQVPCWSLIWPSRLTGC